MDPFALFGNRRQFSVSSSPFSSMDHGSAASSELWSRSTRDFPEACSQRPRTTRRSLRFNSGTARTQQQQTPLAHLGAHESGPLVGDLKMTALATASSGVELDRLLIFAGEDDSDNGTLLGSRRPSFDHPSLSLSQDLNNKLQTKQSQIKTFAFVGYVLGHCPMADSSGPTTDSPALFLANLMTSLDWK